MNCYVCAQRGEELTAVALCLSCGATLCMRHLAERQSHNQGGMKYGCDHSLPQPVAREA